ncbi:MAG: TetR/AcrR family transcriptional regulator [Erythrobacter sp.]
MAENKVRSKKIIDVAIELFSQYGYDGVSTTELSKAVGLSQPSLHYHYGSKMGLWKAAIRELMDRINAEAALDTDALDKMPPVDALKTMFNPSFFKVQKSFPELGRLLQLEGVAGGERLSFLVDNYIAGAYGLYLKYIEAGIEQGAIKPYRPEQILMLMHGALVNYFNMANLVELTFKSSPYDDKNAEDYFAMYMDVMFSAITVDGGSSKK